jgi:hypothetical protein
LVEHATENRSVGGSIPPLGTIPEQIYEPNRLSQRATRYRSMKSVMTLRAKSSEKQDGLSSVQCSRMRAK